MQLPTQSVRGCRHTMHCIERVEHRGRRHDLSKRGCTSGFTLGIWRGVREGDSHRQVRGTGRSGRERPERAGSPILPPFCCPLSKSAVSVHIHAKDLNSREHFAQRVRNGESLLNAACVSAACISTCCFGFRCIQFTPEYGLTNTVGKHSLPSLLVMHSLSCSRYPALNSHHHSPCRHNIVTVATTANCCLSKHASIHIMCLCQHCAHYYLM